MMKRNKIATLGFVLMAVGVLAGCTPKVDPSSSGTSGGSETNSGENNNSNSNTGSNSTTTPELALKPGQELYEDTLVYDLSVEVPYNVAVRVAETKALVSASSGRVHSEDNEVSLKDGVVNFAGSFLSKISAGEKKITLTFSDDSTRDIDAFIATKIIRTGQEFQDINENLEGTYILGNDIDLKSLGNFEPLGYYMDEENPRNQYFHGILEGNGYSVKNGQVYYNSTLADNENVYQGFGMFEHEAHQAGDNIGLFQVIGSSGVVRNVVFDNIKVRGRTIVGVIAGNVMGTVYNCIVTGTSKVQMSTHFYDNDCNTGIAFGIVAGSGLVENCLTLSSGISVQGIYTDYSDDYIGKIGNGWDHSASPSNTDPTWKFVSVDRPKMNYSSGTAVDAGTKEIDSNGSQSNGIYSFAGKVWGIVRDSYGLSFQHTPYEGSPRIAHFSQTHLGSLKPTSGPDDLGTLENCGVKTLAELEEASLYSAFDSTVFKIKDGSLPALHFPLLAYSIVE